FAWSSTKPISNSTNAWRRPGMPEVAPRAIHHRKPRLTKPSRMETASESKLRVQKPPSPSTFVPCVRWWLMYSVGLNSAAIAQLEIRSLVAHEERHGKHEHGGDEGDEKRAGHGVVVVRQHEPQQDQREAELHRFGLQRNDQNPPCGLRSPARSHQRGHQACNQADGAAGGRRYRALRTYQKRGRHGDCRGYRYLPDENLADRLAQAGKHGALSFHARQIRKIITHASLRSAQLVQKLVKVIEARVVHHELAGAL